MDEDRSHEVIRISRSAAAAVAPWLERRLLEAYGGGWLAKVNERRRAEGVAPGRSLNDHRFCLAVFGYDPETDGWVAAEWRRMARELVSLANRAAHDETLTYADLTRARFIGQSFRDGFAQANRVPEMSASDGPRVKSFSRSVDDVETIILVTAQQASERSVIPVTFSVDSYPLESRTVNVRLPPDLSSGKTIRVKGKGIRRDNEAWPGDLYITVVIY